MFRKERQTKVADATETPEDTPKKSKGMIRDIALGSVMLALGVGTGIAAPMVLSGEEADENDSGKGKQELRSLELMDIPEANEKLAFVEFDEVVVNLNDSRYSRYLSCKFSLQISEPQLDAIQKLIDERSVMLKNWLIAHMRDKKLDEVRGMAGQNTLRREIHDRFNEILFSDGIERIQDVLFEDFKVQ